MKMKQRVLQPESMCEALTRGAGKHLCRLMRLSSWAVRSGLGSAAMAMTLLRTPNGVSSPALAFTVKQLKTEACIPHTAVEPPR